MELSETLIFQEASANEKSEPDYPECTTEFEKPD